MADTLRPIDSEAAVILSLMEAGPGTRVLRRLKLAPPLSAKTAVAFCLALIAIAWLPLVVLTIADGDAFRGLAVPFVKDLGAQVRFLFAMPMLVLAEIPIGRRMRHIIGHFLAANLVAKKDADQFADAIAEAMRLRDSRIAEAALVVATALGCWFAVHKGMSAGTGTWYQPTEDGPYSGAGIWYVFVSTPIFQFLLLRWVYRMAIWARALWRISRIDLLLTPTHPDAAGGLMFLGKAVVPFGSIMFALSAVISASVATKVLFAGGALVGYWPLAAALIVLSIVIFAGPLLIFVPKLLEVKHRGLAEYGILASQYTQAFDRKWIARAAGDEPLLGTGDIQSLADLGNSYQMVRKMGLVPIDRPDLVAIAASAALPALPLIATEVPLKVIGTHMLHLLI